MATHSVSEAAPPAGAKARANSDALLVRGLKRHFGPVQALASVDLRVAHGEFLTLLGPSGSGKTTMLRLIAGFDVPCSGSILLDGVNVVDRPPARRNIGMVFQHYALFPHATVRGNVGYGLKMRKWPKAKRNRRVETILETVRLAELADRYPRELSGGQQQRVALARALAFEPSLLLMDEPLGALDRTLRIDMAQELRRIHRELQTSVVYVTHDREEAMTLADRVAVMRAGRILADGTPDELYNSPPSRFVADFFGGHNVVAVDRDSVLLDASGRAELRLFEMPTTVAAAPGAASDPNELAVVIPASRIRLQREDDDNLAVEVTVVETLFLGTWSQVTLCTQMGERLQALVDASQAASLSSGAAAVAYVAPEDLRLVPA